MTKEEIMADISAGRLTYHHSAWAMGYVSRKDGGDYYTDYAGRYGRGVIHHCPSWLSTTYYVKDYYIYKD